MEQVEPAKVGRSSEPRRAHRVEKQSVNSRSRCSTRNESAREKESRKMLGRTGRGWTGLDWNLEEALLSDLGRRLADTPALELASCWHYCVRAQLQSDIRGVVSITTAHGRWCKSRGRHLRHMVRTVRWPLGRWICCFKICPAC